MSDKRQYDDEMRFTLYENDDRKNNEKAPAMTGVGKISGVEIRVALWPSMVSQNTGKKYWSGRFEYKQGTKWMLAKISPANVVVTGATAQVEDKPADGTAAADQTDVGDMPF